MTDALEALAALFPQRSRKELELVLEAHRNNVERAAAYLLEEAHDTGHLSAVNLSEPEEGNSEPQNVEEVLRDCDLVQCTSGSVDNDAEPVAGTDDNVVDEDALLARHLQAEFDREWAVALSVRERNRDGLGSRGTSSPPTPGEQHRGPQETDRSLSTDVREVLDQAQETISHWWHGVKDTVQSWVGEYRSASRSTRAPPQEDPFVGPPHNYAIPEVMSEEHSETAPESSDASEQAWDRPQHDVEPRLAMTPRPRSAASKDSRTLVPPSYTKKDL